MNPDGLASALFGKTRRALLALFFSRPDESFYVREAARAAGASLGAVQRELERLSRAGIIRRFERGRQVYYQANRGCPLFDELRSLIVKTAGLADVLRSALQPLAGEIELAFVFGSQANGTATAASDVDLFVVADIDELELHKAVSSAEAQLGRAVNYVFMKKEEFRRRCKEKRGFVNRILSHDRIILMGER